LAEMEKRAYEKAKRELEMKEDAERRLREAQQNSEREKYMIWSSCVSPPDTETLMCWFL